jgi:hypothetical protein
MLSFLFLPPKPQQVLIKFQMEDKSKSLKIILILLNSDVLKMNKLNLIIKQKNKNTTNSLKIRNFKK